MKEIDNRLFYQVCGWMINDLHLEGKELICYAIIYSLSQLGQGRYYAGLDYLASFMQCSQPTASKAVDGLYTKKLINKQEVVTETGRRVLYFCTDPENWGQENIYGGVHKKFIDPTSYNINKENKEKRISNDIQKKGKKVPDGTRPLSDEEKKFIEGMKKRFPRIMRMAEPLTLEQAKTLKEDYNEDMLRDIMEQMENWKPLTSKKVSAYRTIRNWCNKEKDRP